MEDIKKVSMISAEIENERLLKIIKSLIGTIFLMMILFCTTIVVIV